LRIQMETGPLLEKMDTWGSKKGERKCDSGSYELSRRSPEGRMWGNTELCVWGGGFNSLTVFLSWGVTRKEGQEGARCSRGKKWVEEHWVLTLWIGEYLIGGRRRRECEGDLPKRKA